MNNELKEAALNTRIEQHRKMAESYHMAYVDRTVEEGATYSEWK